MASTTPETFTVGVFKDLTSATRGLKALEQQGFPRSSVSLIARKTPETASLLQEFGGAAGDVVLLAGLDECIATGPFVAALQSEGNDLARKGLAASIRLVGFQPHDGHIFETLTQRGGILVAVRSEPRAADALATLHAYGGGNAAIGAWHGRV